MTATATRVRSVLDSPRGRRFSRTPEPTMLSREQLLLKQMAGNPKVAYRIERGELPLWMHLAAEHRKQEENLDKAGRAPEEQAFPPPRRGRHRTPHRRYGWSVLLPGMVLMLGVAGGRIAEMVL